LPSIYSNAVYYISFERTQNYFPEKKKMLNSWKVT